MAKVVMYSTGICPYCVRAEIFLSNKGITDIEKIRVDLHPEKRIEMMELTNRRTVPQVFIENIHIGGFDDLVEFDRTGKLDELIASS